MVSVEIVVWRLTLEGLEVIVGSGLLQGACSEVFGCLRGLR
jgi:hypothetical protein